MHHARYIVDQVIVGIDIADSTQPRPPPSGLSPNTVVLYDVSVCILSILFTIPLLFTTLSQRDVRSTQYYYLRVPYILLLEQKVHSFLAKMLLFSHKDLDFFLKI